MKTYRIEFRYSNGELEYSKVQARSFDDAEDRLAREFIAAGLDPRKIDITGIDKLVPR